MERNASGLEYNLGESARYFSLPATDGKIYSLADFIDKSALVIIFTCNHCPYAQAYEERICQLADTYQPKGAQIITVCSNDASGYPEDDFAHMIEKSKKLGFRFPYLHDEKQVMARAYDAACTPEVYLFNRQQKLTYHGRIDDNYKDARLVTKHDLRDALEATLAGETPQVQLTSSMGCSIKWKK